MQYIFERRKQAHITFSGDKLPMEENALVISNHQSWTDIYLIHAVANRKGMLQNCKYFVKDSIKYLPFFGWGMWLAGFPFVRRNWTQDQKKIQATFDTIKRLETPAWIINYVEGSRITPQKLTEAQQFSKERGYTVMRNVLLPRTRGFISCVNTLRISHIKYVYDLTIAYQHQIHSTHFHQAPTMVRVHVRSLWPEYRFHVHCRRYAIEDLPKDEQQLSDWLRKRWAEKDYILELLKKQWTKGLDPAIMWAESPNKDYGTCS
ncbi:acyltransferase-domain-containing protein [Mycotypha africana]|uniref:acyltransferase-domain-containing protein n=1 Tax=Mycotypha africana TaxID=64632 RepID=UPI002300C251|nr:acyltransferase-domain-containing protein [Mycotypha africana]KAI8979128.1 acyltransferase-domain-containing protein [Mycotypha africana]